MPANDIPEQFVLRGISGEDVSSILTQFRKRVELKGYSIDMSPLERYMNELYVFSHFY